MSNVKVLAEIGKWRIARNRYPAPHNAIELYRGNWGCGEVSADDLTDLRDCVESAIGTLQNEANEAFRAQRESATAELADL